MTPPSPTPNSRDEWLLQAGEQPPAEEQTENWGEEPNHDPDAPTQEHGSAGGHADNRNLLPPGGAHAMPSGVASVPKVTTWRSAHLTGDDLVEGGPAALEARRVNVWR